MVKRINCPIRLPVFRSRVVGIPQNNIPLVGNGAFRTDQAKGDCKIGIQAGNCPPLQRGPLRPVLARIEWVLRRQLVADASDGETQKIDTAVVADGSRFQVFIECPRALQADVGISMYQEVGELFAAAIARVFVEKRKNMLIALPRPDRSSLQSTTLRVATLPILVSVDRTLRARSGEPVKIRRAGALPC